MKISFNSKVILIFSVIAIVVKIVHSLIPGFTSNFFVVGSTMSFTNPLDYFCLVSHVVGHSSWDYLMGNLIFILLLGPILEEKYGHNKMFWMIIFTALAIGVINVMFFSNNLLGASGIVFMLIILVSCVGKNGSIPIELLLVAFIFIGKEVVNGFSADNVSQTAHILGGIFGAIFGFVISRPKKELTNY